MLKLINQYRIPYGGMYQLNNPAKGMVGSGMKWETLLRSVREYRVANSIPIGLGFENEVERELCEQYPQECTEDGKNIKRRRFGFSEILRGTKVILLLLSSGRELVKLEEAERRAAICAVCRQNQDYQKPCGGICEQLKRVVVGIIGHQVTAKDKELKACQICGCLNQAQVWVPLPILAKGITDDMRQQFKAVPDCWKKEA